jgi:hypothetical protein
MGRAGFEPPSAAATERRRREATDGPGFAITLSAKSVKAGTCTITVRPT